MSQKTPETAPAITSVSVVVPAYNVATWIGHTLGTVVTAFERAGIEQYEVVVVNDGSTDDTAEVVGALSAANERIVRIDQTNAGRLPAVQAGLDAARYDTTLIINPRIEVFPESFNALNDYLRQGKHSKVWNGHVTIKYGWNPFARFWGVVTHLGWRAYLARPRYVEFGLEEFDSYPKGTGFLLAPTQALRDAARTFDTMMDDPRFASDDTGVIRNLAQTYRIAIAPEFGCWYAYGRTSLRAFAKHTFDRGTFFVDSYFRRGTRFFVPLLAFIVISLAALALLPFFPLPILGAAAALWILVVLAAAVLRSPPANVVSFALVAPMFTLIFGAGLWRGFFFVARARWRARSSR